MEIHSALRNVLENVRETAKKNPWENEDVTIHARVTQPEFDLVCALLDSWRNTFFNDEEYELYDALFKYAADEEPLTEEEIRHIETLWRIAYVFRA